MFNLPVFVGIDYHTHMIQVCVMDSQRKWGGLDLLDRKRSGISYEPVFVFALLDHSKATQ